MHNKKEEELNFYCHLLNNLVKILFVYPNIFLGKKLHTTRKISNKVVKI